jgi:uncharacterized surface protein with fasciclin (FAS1) repeats
MMKKLFVIMIALATSVSAFSQNKDVVDIAIGSADHTTLVAAVQAADLVTTLKSAGPFTVFAPTNEAFAKLPAGTVESLLQPENKDQLTKILTYHVISGSFDAASIMAAIEEGNGNVDLTTVSGGTLNASIENGKVKLTDETGNFAFVTATDLEGSNGVIHVIDGVVLPK